MRTVSFKRNAYKSGDAYYICDRCGQRHRRSGMMTEWDGLKVNKACLDPRPPQMFPPNVYPEGIPFVDARPPQDNPDRLTDDTSIFGITGGIGITNGQLIPGAPDGAISPQEILTGYINSPSMLQDDVTLRTGTIPSPSIVIEPTPTPPPTNLTAYVEQMAASPGNADYVIFNEIVPAGALLIIIRMSHSYEPPAVINGWQVAGWSQPQAPNFTYGLQILYKYTVQGEESNTFTYCSDPENSGGVAAYDVRDTKGNWDDDVTALTFTTNETIDTADLTLGNAILDDYGVMLGFASGQSDSIDISVSDVTMNVTPFPWWISEQYQDVGGPYAFTGFTVDGFGPVEVETAIMFTDIANIGCYAFITIGTNPPIIPIGPPVL